MLEVMLNPPKKGKKKGHGTKAKGKGKAARRKVKVCVPVRALRSAKTLKRLRRDVLHPGKRVCFTKASLARAKSLKKFKRRYAGVKYGFARMKGKKAGMKGGALPLLEASGVSLKRGKTKSRKAAAPKVVRYEYMEIFNMTPLERSIAGVTEKHLETARKRGYAMVKPPEGKKSAAPVPGLQSREIAANPRRYRYNYTVPAYAFNDAASFASMDGLRQGITAGYRPAALMQAVPIVGGLIGNSIVAGSLSKMLAEKMKLSDAVKGPVSIGVGLATAGALSMVTKMVAPSYSRQVLLGGLSQVLWDAYKTYLQPLMQKHLGVGCCPDLTFGLWCPECADGLNDFLTPGQIKDARSVIDQSAAQVIPPSEVAMQAAPLTAKVNGQEVQVERVVPGGTSGFGDFLTPNQVAQASPLGGFGAL